MGADIVIVNLILRFPILDIRVGEPLVRMYNAFAFGGPSLGHPLFLDGTVNHHLLDGVCDLAKLRTFAPFGFQSIKTEPQAAFTIRVWPRPVHPKAL
jgi:hypothetical protein